MRILVAGLSACAFAFGCGSSTSGAEQPDPPAGAGGVASEAGASDAPMPSGSGAGTVSGSVDGAPYGAVSTAFWAGAPDDATTTVIYVFSAPVPCTELASPGWDSRIANATKVLEMKAIGTTAATYSVVTTPTPAPGEASVNFTLSSTSGTPKEQSSSAGTLTLKKLTPNASAQGEFSFTFGKSTVTGSFDAVFCPGGHEP
jgi:hypothetical protein